MEYESILARDISLTAEGAALDAVCKRLLANKSILAWILKDCVKEYRNCTITEIEQCIENEPQIAEVAVNPNETSTTIKGLSNVDSSITEGTVTYDIRFMATVPVSGDAIQLIINVEAQNDFYPGYPLIKRGLYYCSRMISAQYGTEFTRAQYGNIKKVYSIWVCVNPPKNRENSITSYSITEKNLIGNVREKVANYDLMTAVMICLGDSNKCDNNGVLKLLETLLSSELKADTKKQVLQDDFNISMVQRFDSEVSNMCNISKGIIEKALTDGLAQGIEQGIEQGIAQGIEQGIEQGIVQGIEQGIEQGRVKERITLIRNMISKMDITFEKAMQLLDISEDEYPKYKELLNKSM